MDRPLPQKDVVIQLQALFQQLFTAYGPRHWWPADTPFEMMVGAILTQNTAWTNVERAISALKVEGWLTAATLRDAPLNRLEQAVRPAGYFRQKSIRLQGFARFYLEQGEANAMRQVPLPEMRERLLAVNGVGPETADSMLLYALNQPIFVIDAYTKRLLSRLGKVEGNIGYHALQAYCQQHLPKQTTLFQEFHALIVEHAKQHCRAKPICSSCPLANQCPFPSSDS